MTTMTRIVLDALHADNRIPGHIRHEARQLGLEHRDAVSFAIDQAIDAVIEGLTGSEMPAFAQGIINHAIKELVDWRFIGERLISAPEEN